MLEAPQDSRIRRKSRVDINVESEAVITDNVRDPVVPVETHHYITAKYRHTPVVLIKRDIGAAHTLPHVGQDKVGGVIANPEEGRLLKQVGSRSISRWAGKRAFAQSGDDAWCFTLHAIPDEPFPVSLLEGVVEDLQRGRRRWFLRPSSCGHSLHRERSSQE